MSDGELGVFRDVAAKAARAAGSHIIKNLGALHQGDVDRKQAYDFVTRVDRESETLIIGIIREAFPSHVFLSEESLRDEAAPGVYRWIIDPLDGTTNFIHSYPMFGVSIALELDGVIIAAVVYDPLRDEMFSAMKDRGAFMGQSRLSVSAHTDISFCLLTTGFPFKNKEMLSKYFELFTALFNQVSGIRRAGAAALDLAHLAAGRCDGFFELGLSPWDIAAGSLLITEAGGIITDYGGGDDYLWSGNVLAGTSSTHPVILRHARVVFSGVVDK